VNISALGKSNTVRVGIGVIIEKGDGKILVGKRKGSHAPFYSIPGGHLDPGETFEKCAVREVREETDLLIRNPKVIAVTNNLETCRNEGLHYISVVLLAKEFSGKLKLMEPKKCEEWIWTDQNNLPLPHFDASKRSIACYLGNTFYQEFEY